MQVISKTSRPSNRREKSLQTGPVDRQAEIKSSIITAILDRTRSTAGRGMFKGHRLGASSNLRPVRRGDENRPPLQDGGSEDLVHLSDDGALHFFALGSQSARRNEWMIDATH
jgi:hypothetical protein